MTYLEWYDVVNNYVDPGISGKKLSKSDTNATEERNKSYSKVLDAQINWIRAHQSGSDEAPDLKVRWEKKLAWHEQEYGW